MSQGKTYYVTKEGLEKMKKELEFLTTVERKRISQQIAEARDKGDLSENAEYDAAKEAQGILEMKIVELQEKIRNARVIDQSKLGNETVKLMNKVKLKDLKNNRIIEYYIVPENESDFKQGKISVNTPIAKGLLGKKKGEKVQIKVPAGLLEFEILEITV